MFFFFFFVYFFFFQAEDGIRDRLVTGVQTCALPICGSSIYPAVQNILLAARALDLGSAITTLHKRYEKEIKDLLGIPDNVETAALLPIGFIQEGYKYGPTSRAPVSEVTYWEKWDES